jgi:hypothetical protein
MFTFLLLVPFDELAVEYHSDRTGERRCINSQ